MKKVTIWKLTYHSDPDPGSCLEFCATRYDADHRFIECRRIHKENGNTAHSQTIVPLTVTLTKEGILQLLEYHCPATDNG